VTGTLFRTSDPIVAGRIIWAEGDTRHNAHVVGKLYTTHDAFTKAIQHIARQAPAYDAGQGYCKVQVSFWLKSGAVLRPMRWELYKGRECLNEIPDVDLWEHA
jgi:hypothetical protein